MRPCDNCGIRQSKRGDGLLRMALCDWCYDRLNHRIRSNTKNLDRILRRLAEGKSVTL